MSEALNKGRIGSLARTHNKRWSLVSFYGPILSAAIAGGDNKTIEMVMTSTIKSGVDLRMIDEIVLQSHLFLGFPAMIEASRILASLRQPRSASVRLPRGYSEAQCRSWNRDGIKKMRHIYGGHFDSLIRYINSFSPRILGWMINDGYGRVLSRPGLSFDQRELSIVAILTVTGYLNQLRAHIRGAVNVGLDRDLIEATIQNCHFFCPVKKIKDSLKILRQTEAA